ncbi:MAG: hydrogenase [Proteobacteria bacterium]|nr:hydrogenase [Pseudomonadota bacterium]MBU1737862.1 hydrogenase [Pseudomonadota bacterium]
MNDLATFILLTVILLNFFILGSSRLGACIRVVAVQGALLAVLSPLVHGPNFNSLTLMLGAMCIKGGVIPWLLLRAIRQVMIRREIEPRIGYIMTLMLGALTTAGAFIFADRLPLLPEHQHSLFIPAAFSTLGAGFLMLITRRKAITQVLGYLIFENGIFIFGILLAEAMPLLVEAGVLLDMLVAIFVMGIVMNHINREFSSTDTEHLCLLKE